MFQFAHSQECNGIFPKVLGFDDILFNTINAIDYNANTHGLFVGGNFKQSYGNSNIRLDYYQFQDDLVLKWLKTSDVKNQISGVALSPDGSRAAFHSDDEKNPVLYILNATNGDVLSIYKLSASVSSDLTFRFRSLVFSSPSNPEVITVTQQIYLYTFRTSSNVQQDYQGGYLIITEGSYNFGIIPSDQADKVFMLIIRGFRQLVQIEFDVLQITSFRILQSINSQKILALNVETVEIFGFDYQFTEGRYNSGTQVITRGTVPNKYGSGVIIYAICSETDHDFLVMVRGRDSNQSQRKVYRINIPIAKVFGEANAGLAVDIIESASYGDDPYKIQLLFSPCQTDAFYAGPFLALLNSETLSLTLLSFLGGPTHYGYRVPMSSRFYGTQQAFIAYSSNRMPCNLEYYPVFNTMNQVGIITSSDYAINNCQTITKLMFQASNKMEELQTVQINLIKILQDYSFLNSTTHLKITDSQSYWNNQKNNTLKEYNYQHLCKSERIQIKLNISAIQSLKILAIDSSEVQNKSRYKFQVETTSLLRYGQTIITVNAPSQVNLVQGKCSADLELITGENFKAQNCIIQNQILNLTFTPTISQNYIEGFSILNFTISPGGINPISLKPINQSINVTIYDSEGNVFDSGTPLSVQVPQYISSQNPKVFFEIMNNTGELNLAIVSNLIIPHGGIIRVKTTNIQLKSCKMNGLNVVINNQNEIVLNETLTNNITV